MDGMMDFRIYHNGRMHELTIDEVAEDFRAHGALILSYTEICGTYKEESVTLTEFKVIPKMRYTGLHDKNGKRIFEGDILTTDLSYPYLIVEFKNGCFVYKCRDSGDNYCDDYYDIMMPVEADAEKWKDYHEIVGNIYENPELLERG